MCHKRTIPHKSRRVKRIFALLKKAWRIAGDGADFSARAKETAPLAGRVPHGDFRPRPCLKPSRDQIKREDAVKLFISAVSVAPGVFNHSTPAEFADEIINGAEKLRSYIKGVSD
jgi:hypothetical protein